MSVRVTMVTQNDWYRDARVAREAVALADAGHDVTVLSRRDVPETLIESAGGVRHIVLPLARPASPRALGHALRLHLRVLRAARDAGSVLETAALVFVALAAIPALVATIAIRKIPSLRRLLRPVSRRTVAARRLVSEIAQPWLYLNEFETAAHGVILETTPDVVHAHDLVTLAGAASAATAAGAQLVYDAHELETETNYRLSRFTKRELRRYERIFARRAVAVVTVCDSIADWLAGEYGIPRPTVVLNAPPIDRETPLGDLRSELALPADTPLAVYVGFVTIDRGLEQTVDALVHTPSYHLATVGPRDPDVEASIRQRANARGVENRVHLVDPVPADTVSAYIRTATCSVIPIQNTCLSYYFCFPNKLLESVFAGLPVAVADLVEMRRFVESTDCGLVMDERDPRAIAGALDELAADRGTFVLPPQKLAELATRYGWEAQASLLIDLYGTLEEVAA